MGAAVVELDMARPFTAARARNEGFAKLCELNPANAYVQFVDGDCEVVDGWLELAVSFLDQNDNVAVVCGRRRERFPAISVYNMLCDIEWDTPVGDAKACGGDAMMRSDALREVGAFKKELIAGEEPELCVRLRHRGWKIWRLDADMTLHDADMTMFSQWWMRTVRGGYAFAEGSYLHGKRPERHWVREFRSSLIWGIVAPVVTVTIVYFYGLWALTLLLIYPLQIVRLTIKGSRGFKVNILRAFFLVLGKFPEMIGGIKFIYNRISDTNSRIIEYK
jgi:GT2 family glycosyltransferase